MSITQNHLLSMDTVPCPQVLLYFYFAFPTAVPRWGFKPSQQSTCSPAGNKPTGEQDMGSVHGISASLLIFAEQGITHLVPGTWQKIHLFLLYSSIVHVYTMGKLFLQSFWSAWMKTISSPWHRRGFFHWLALCNCVDAAQQWLNSASFLTYLSPHFFYVWLMVSLCFLPPTLSKLGVICSFLFWSTSFSLSPSLI